MSSLTLSRRTFLKTSAVAAAAVGLSAGAESALAAAPYTAVDSAGEVKRIRTCCRGCGKMECGVWVTVENGRAVKIEGDESAPHTMGSCCNKSVSSLQACYHPDRLRYPMKRTNPKGEDPGWVRIGWDEALDAIVEGIQQVKDKYGGEALFTMGGTGRIWCMSPYAGYGPWFMTPNTSVAWQVCKGPRHFASALTSEYN
ncbi:MAG: molybdopterin-dependent oxidoreductase, partial [Adlercreutzia equolifaciens]